MSVQRFFQRGRYSRNSPKIYLFHNFTSSDSHTKPSNPSNHYHCHNHRYSQYVHFRNFLSPSKPQLVIPHSVSFCCRSFSTRDSPNGDIANTELFISENVSASVEESILPVRALISLLDGFHDFTGIPWYNTPFPSNVGLSFFLVVKITSFFVKLKFSSKKWHWLLIYWGEKSHYTLLEMHIQKLSEQCKNSSLWIVVAWL